jgi:hypothetical protein
MSGNSAAKALEAQIKQSFSRTLAENSESRREHLQLTDK